jgi:hypothetical protein
MNEKIDGEATDTSRLNVLSAARAHVGITGSGISPKGIHRGSLEAFSFPASFNFIETSYALLKTRCET